ncbi:MAG: hypothetical protein A2X61_10010 [Ignavibacteria bacterium GWB2_35_12]|nr:MAG: hypothetical protein A2X63_06290 [Ignavibacteria bacterium GWA2_35_8]OGU39684.1 MAG: hypothetical protein A2X61_10010 [Ignavibacteria bacterium GWB2_35_12]OGU96446.1 MAG: hypothetical protein A2220_05375 [Ignavibacteria bacterium RIFOXYA2_FULL_35_10]OGV23879.1 MAG: hypothetical protein A2475_07200 [Ignavibacteria bacterium RIFOXYC2_FULL_35_21]
MIIERTKGEVIIKVPSFVNTEGIQRIIDLLAYREATAKSNAKEKDIDNLVKEIKKGWWAKNKKRFVK